MKTLLTILLIANIISAGTMPPQAVSATIKQLETQLRQKKALRSYSFQNKAALEKFIGHIAKHYAVDKLLLMGIVRQESAYCKYKLNKVTGDSGCMQIHKSNIAAYGWNKDTIMKHDAANIVAGAIILADFKRKFSANEPKTWMCRYNIGYRSLPQQCITYLNKVYKAD